MTTITVGWVRACDLRRGDVLTAYASDNPGPIVDRVEYGPTDSHNEGKVRIHTNYGSNEVDRWKGIEVWNPVPGDDRVTPTNEGNR